MFQKSFVLRILFLNVLLLILPVLFYFFLLFNWQYEAKVKKAIFELHDIASARSSILGEKIDEAFTALGFADSFLDLEHDTKVTSDQISTTLSKVKVAGDYTAVSYYEKKGENYIAVQSTDTDILGKDLSYRNYVKYAQKYGKSVQVAYGDFPHEWPLLFVSKAIALKKSDENAAMFVIAAFIEEFLSKITDTSTITQGARISVITEDEIVFQSSENDFVRRALRPLSEERIITVESAKQFGSKPLKFGALDFVPYKNSPDAYEWLENGKKHIGVRVLVPGTSLSILIDEDLEHVIKEFYYDFWKIIVILLLIVIIVTLLDLWMTKRLSRPLIKLFEAMKQIGAGNYEVRYQPQLSGFEINDLGEALNQMTANIVHYMKTVKDERIKKEVLAKELRIGRDIQMSILPQVMPKVENIDLAARSMPAKEVGGCFFDAYEKFNETDKTKKELVLTVGDTSGKGISACLYAFCLRSMLRSYGMQYSNVAKVMRLANNLFYLDTERTSIHVTAFTVIYNPKDRSFDFYSAGHIPALLLRKNGSIEKLDNVGLALGVMPLEKLEKKSETFDSGDILVIYTDGFMKVMNTSGEFFTEQEIIDCVRNSAHQSAASILDNLFHKVQNFSASAALTDDITCLIMKRS